jgi:hypothetical protein
VAISSVVFAAAVAAFEGVQAAREAFVKVRQAQARALKPEAEATAARIDRLVREASQGEAAHVIPEEGRSPGPTLAPASLVGEASPTSAGGAGASLANPKDSGPPGSR